MPHCIFVRFNRLVIAPLFFLTLTIAPTMSAEFLQITPDNWKAICPKGKEVDWIFGDYVLRNDKLTVVIARPIQTRNANMTVRNVGGAIIDMTFRFRPSDQLSCFYPGASEFPIRYLKSSADDDGITVTVSSDWRAEQPDMEVDYRLNDGDSFVTVTTRFTNRHDQEVRFPLRDSVRADRGFTHRLDESFYVCADLWWKQAYAIQPIDHKLEAVADSLDKSRPVIAYEGAEGGRVRLAPGEQYTLVRRLIPGESELSVESMAKKLAGDSVTPCAFVVTDPNGFVPNAQITLKQGDKLIGKALTPEAGPLMVSLPAGDYAATVSEQSRGSITQNLSVRDERLVRKFEMSEPAYVQGTIQDDNGSLIPAKIQFISETGDDPNFGPDTKSFGVKNVQYTGTGEFRAELAPGEYRVIISRGNEYDADFQTINVEMGETTELKSTLKRSVQTIGWVSTDYHSHSSPSGDNTSEQFGRVLNLLAEHVEFAPCTEHNRISSYAPHLQRLQAEAFMATCTGMELTGKPLPVNHQNAFPLHHHPHTQDGGGPTTLENPVAQIERLAMWDDGSDKLVQENHPNLEQIWADQNLDGEEDSGFEKMFGFMDVMEVHPPADIFAKPGTKTGQYNNAIQSWLRMLNKGYRIPGVVNTDAHYNFHGSGWLRNYVKSSTDLPAEIDTMEMVHESEHGHVVMTNGPYLEVTASSGDERAIPGDDLKAPSMYVNLEVKVQCPNWFDINRVQVLINGRLSEGHHFTRRTTPDKFADGTVKFKHTIEVELEEDAHLIVATIGDGLKLGPVMGPTHGEDVPVAFSNPIFVDVDGDGFRPNDDLLGLPFPFKAE